MSFTSLNMHCSPLTIKREPFESTVAIKLEALESPKKVMSNMHQGSNDLLKCKKQRVNFAKMNYQTALIPPTSVARRNERERNRVKMVNNGFATLRQHVPNGAKNKKMSKVETLRSAVEYIRQLQRLLGTNNENSYLDEQFDLASLPSTSGDENCYPSPVPSDHRDHRDHHHHLTSSLMEVSSASMESMSYLNTVPYDSVAGSALYGSSSSEGCSKLGSSSTYSVASPAVFTSRTSPTPSLGSDITNASSSASPYDAHHHSQPLDSSRTHHSVSVAAHDDELFDFTNWF